MVNWYRYKRDNPQLVVPEQISAADWKPILPDNEQIYSLAELAALFNPASEETENARYTRENWLAVGHSLAGGSTT